MSCTLDSLFKIQQYNYLIATLHDVNKIHSISHSWKNPTHSLFPFIEQKNKKQISQTPILLIS